MRNDLRERLPPLPERMKSLHVDARGYPVPWFVEWVDGEPKFQIADATKLPKAIKRGLCWLCGKPMGSFKTFLIGPMCGVNRVSAEPPSHRDCAEFAVRACPFLSRPLAQRTDRGIEDIDEVEEPAGVVPVPSSPSDNRALVNVKASLRHAMRSAGVCPPHPENGGQ